MTFFKNIITQQVRKYNIKIIKLVIYILLIKYYFDNINGKLLLFLLQLFIIFLINLSFHRGENNKDIEFCIIYFKFVKS